MTVNQKPEELKIVKCGKDGLCKNISLTSKDPCLIDFILLSILSRRGESIELIFKFSFAYLCLEMLES